MPEDRMDHEEFRAAQSFLGLSDSQLADRIGLKKAQSVRRYKTAPGRNSHRRIPLRKAEIVRQLVTDELGKL